MTVPGAEATLVCDILDKGQGVEAEQTGHGGNILAGGSRSGTRGVSLAGLQSPWLTRVGLFLRW